MNRSLSLVIALATIVTTMKAQSPYELHASSPASLQPTVLLAWKSPTNVSFFKIYRSSPDTTNFQWIAVSQARQFEDTGVMAGVDYNYAVTAVAFEGSILVESARSNIASVRAYTLPHGPKGMIAGTVIDQQSGLPLSGITVRFFKMPSPENRGLATRTTATGTYTAILDTGGYIIRAEEAMTTTSQSRHRAEWYIGASEPGDAKPVAVNENDTTRVDFSLVPESSKPYAYVSGFVRDEDGIPIAGAVVAFARPIQELVAGAAIESQPPGTGSEARVIPGLGYSRGVAWVGYTTPSGEYFAQVSTDRQYVAMATSGGYYPKFFGDASDPTQAMILTINGDTSSVDFSLRKKADTDNGAMDGVVQDSSGNGIPSRIILFPRPKEGGSSNPAVFTFTDSTGEFSIQNITSGSYCVLAVPFADYAPSFASTSGAGVISWIDADTIEVSESTPYLTISVPALDNAGLTRISGTVEDANGAPIAGVRVVARRADGTITGYGLSNPTGSYVVEALGTGSVILHADRFQFSHVQTLLTVPLNTFSIQGVNFVLSSSLTDTEEQILLPLRTQLMQNYPNPFNPTTTIRITIAGVVAPSGASLSGVEGPASSSVRLAVYDLLGREVAILVNESKAPGSYEVKWDATGLASGVYMYRLTAGDFVESRTMLLLR